MSSRTKKSLKRPPPEPIKSLQMDLFSSFVSNDDAEVSNTVEFWEAIPKHFFTPQQVKKLRTQDGLAKSYYWPYKYNGTAFTVKIQPALVEKDGNELAFFPSVTEELVEEAIKKILSDQKYGIHNPLNAETWVRFTLRMVQKELKSRGRTRSLPEISHAITVMSRCVVTLYRDDKEIWSGAILQDLVTVGRDEYLEDRNSQHVARLPLFISHAINKLEYRQFNLDRLMSCDNQLSRWIYRRLVHRYTQASYMNDYHFMFSELKASSALLQQGTETNNRRKLEEALQELVKEGVLISYESDVRKDGKKIIDVKYIVRPSMDFVREQKAANKRTTDARTVLDKQKRFIGSS